MSLFEKRIRFFAGLRSQTFNSTLEKLNIYSNVLKGT